MEEQYRIKEIPESVPPMWKLEVYKQIMKGGRPRAWRVVCLSEDLDILEGMIVDFIGQALEEHNGLRKQS